MSRKSTFLRLCSIPVIALAVTVGTRSSAVHADIGPLEMFSADVEPEVLQDLLRAGYDVADARRSDQRVEIDLVLTRQEKLALQSEGIDIRLWRNPDGLTASQLARLQQDDGYEVFRPWDGDDGLARELHTTAADHPDIVKLVVEGKTNQDREVIALKVTSNANSVEDGTRPAVLYNALQHAREWISVEVNRRLLHYLVENYGIDPTVTELLDTRELWFVIVANPDGYQYSYDHERLWRKNLRDNDGDGEITDYDGVDLNRNFDAHWGYDDEGSSPSPTSSGFRGTGPASEPETRAMQSLLDRIGFSFMVNYHSVGPDLLYGTYTWQVDTPSADEPIYLALSGDRERPAVEGFYPHSMMYLTNGNTREYAHGVTGALCWTPELSDAGSGGGFQFPDDEALVQREFEINLPFALDVALSAGDPARPVSHLGNTVEPLISYPFSVSYGDPQVVQVNAARYAGDIDLRYTINDGDAHTASTHEWDGGERYGDSGDVHFHVLRGMVRGAVPGDHVTVWFESRDGSSEPFTYELVSDSGAPVLVVAAEDYTGSSPKIGGAGPAYIQYYLDALEANGIPADVYDIDYHDRAAPSALGVLGHYRAAIWYTGDDIVTREPGMAPGTASRVANDTLLAVRDFLNEGGRVLYTGKYAGYQFASQQFDYDPVANLPCGVPGGADDCDNFRNDFMQYYMGVNSYHRTINAPVDRENFAGEGIGLWSGASNNADRTIQRVFDLPTGPITPTLTFDSYWDTEADYDWCRVEASVDGGTSWTPIRDVDGLMVETDPDDQTEDWGLSGVGQAQLRFDVTPHVAVTNTLTLRLRYQTDRGSLGAGWFVDNLVLAYDAGNIYENDFENDFSDWSNNGWLTAPQEPPEGPTIYPVIGAAEPFEGLRWEFGAPGGAENQDHSGAGSPTSHTLSVAEYPQFESWNAAVYDRPGITPHSGDHYAYSGMTYYTYQRLSRTVDLSDADSAELSFWTSYDVREPWDAIFVEARTSGEDDWTTLPDRNGNTSDTIGLNCTTQSWYDRHPHLAHYMSVDSGSDPAQCVPTGSTGQWQAATGQSEGWQQWTVDLSAYAGSEMEVAIAYVSSRLAYAGMFIDDVELSTGEFTSFEDGLGHWAVSGAPEGSNPNTDDFRIVTLADYPQAAIAVTRATIFFGFGFEAISRPEDRIEVMDRAMEYLLRSSSQLFLPALQNQP